MLLLEGCFEVGMGASAGSAMLDRAKMGPRRWVATISGKYFRSGRVQSSKNAFHDSDLLGCHTALWVVSMDA